MKPIYTFSDYDRDLLKSRLLDIKQNPYSEYKTFSACVQEAAGSSVVQDLLGPICETIRTERATGVSDVHALRNCPIDDDIPLLDRNDPLQDKYRRKKTHVSEAFLAVFSLLNRTPLLSYSSRHGGDFFTDVIAIKKLEGQATGFTDGDLVYHNDLTPHAVRADYITLLGMRCEPEDMVYTVFIDGKDLLVAIPEHLRGVLRKPHFFTPFDSYSRSLNAEQIDSGAHAILEGDHCFRFRDTATTVLPTASVEAKDALLALKDALAIAPRHRHRILKGDLLTLANMNGLHTRKRIEVSNFERAKDRWLQKTYSFRDEAACLRYESLFRDGIQGLISD